jgi:hypothetical protein
VTGRVRTISCETSTPAFFGTADWLCFGASPKAGQRAEETGAVRRGMPSFDGLTTIRPSGSVKPWGVLWGVMRLPRNSGNVKAKVKSDAVRRNHGESCHRYREPCIRGLRFPVSRLLGLLAAGETRESILKAYPYLRLRILTRPSGTRRSLPRTKQWNLRSEISRGWPYRRIWRSGLGLKGMMQFMPAS